MNNAINGTLPMNFSNVKFSTAEDWMWKTVFYKGERATVVGYDAESFAVPMLRVLFATGRIGTLKPSELGAK